LNNVTTQNPQNINQTDQRANPAKKWVIMHDVLCIIEEN